MSSISDFLTPEAINKLGQLAIRSRYVTEGSISGTHKSPFKGQSMEFADRRRYIKGDNIKDLDWKVFGRTERYYIRQFEEETSLRVSLLLDASASMGYQSGERMSKYDYACRVAAAVGYVITKQQDSLGLYLYNNVILEKIPARNGTRHFRLILDRLAAHKPAGRTSTGETLHTLAETISRRGLIMLFTDCFDDTEAIFHAIAHFRKRMHDVVLLQILDPAELELPMKQASSFYDMETNERIEIDPSHARLAYKKELQAFVDAIRKHCATMNVDYRLVSTAEPFDSFIREYLVERRRMSL
jgi:uncharacterized protein (DUF58 family)